MKRNFERFLLAPQQRSCFFKEEVGIKFHAACLIIISLLHKLQFPKKISNSPTVYLDTYIGLYPSPARAESAAKSSDHAAE